MNPAEFVPEIDRVKELPIHVFVKKMLVAK